MYIIDSENNRLIKAIECTFKELGFEERKNLQEWIAKEPSSLGEELLIIQKEFDGFADTRERLDLLAMDKCGNLVVIENKLDDSGRDVTWQAIKYASYCSTLSKQDIVDIFQKYLGSERNAKDEIVDFLEVEDFSDAKINQDNSQRIIFVAANFRREVTSSVMWLLNYRLDIKCVKVCPYKYDDKLYLDFDQIIPVKDAGDYTIKIANKKLDENQESTATKNRHNGRQQFWSEFIEYNKDHNGLYATSSGTPDNWLGKSVRNLPNTSVNIIIGTEKCRTEIYINTGSKEKNKEIFDKLYQHKDEIEKEYGEPLVWQRMDGKVTCRIRHDKDLSYQECSERQQVFDFFIQSTDRMIKVFNDIGKKYPIH